MYIYIYQASESAEAATNRGDTLCGRTPPRVCSNQRTTYGCSNVTASPSCVSTRRTSAAAPWVFDVCASPGCSNQRNCSGCSNMPGAHSLSMYQAYIYKN